MDITTLTLLMKLHRRSKSDVARAVGISRQAISLWFTNEKGFQNIQVKHLISLAKSFNTSLDTLAYPLSSMPPLETIKKLYNEFCWDHSYPDFLTFLIALVHKEEKAIARFIQCRGIYAAASTIGQTIWSQYPSYKKHIHPAKKREIDIIWKTHQSLMKA